MENKIKQWGDTPHCKIGDLVLVKGMPHWDAPNKLGTVIKLDMSFQGQHVVSVMFANTGRVSKYGPNRLKVVSAA